MTLDNLKEKIDILKNELEEDIDNIDFDSLTQKYTSKSSKFNEIIKLIPLLSDELKSDAGILINETKNYINSKIELVTQNKVNDSTTINFDYSLPGIKPEIGNYHPTTITIREINDFFKHYGYSVAIGPEIESDEYNFEKLNLPKNHPARDLQDTLYISMPETLLRTHTSSVETRTMTSNKPPIRVVVPGKAYRNETVNKTNNAIFYQYEGLVIDEGITMAHLKGTLTDLIRYLFGENTKYRFRPKFYPQVEPGVGADIECPFCTGKGCGVCKTRGWIEAAGAGMVHPNALSSCGIDPTKYIGFAFGFGLDRLVMAKQNISDIRELYQGKIVYK